jgi:hypothetical protein
MPCVRAGSYLADGAEWQMLAVRGGRILARGQLYSTTPADGQIIPPPRCAVAACAVLARPSLAPCGTGLLRAHAYASIKAGCPRPGPGREERVAIRRVISTLNSDGSETMGPGIIMYHYPANHCERQPAYPGKKSLLCAEAPRRDPERLAMAEKPPASAGP